MAVEPRHAWLVAVREYLENVRTRGFWLSILLMPLLLLLLATVPLLLAGAEGPAPYSVLDYSGWVQRAVAERLAGRDAARLVDALSEQPASEQRSRIGMSLEGYDRTALIARTAATYLQLEAGSDLPHLATDAAAAPPRSR